MHTQRSEGESALQGSVHQEWGTHDDRGLEMQHTGTARRSQTNGVQRRAVGLGWFSLGLGVAQLVAPRGVARAVGAPDRPGTRATMLTIGLREITTGLGILARSQSQPSGWIWTRVLGDLVDIALLSRALGSKRAERTRLAIAATALLGVTLLDTITALELGRTAKTQQGKRGIDARGTITINRPPDEVYRFWRDFQNLPRFMAHLESVKVDNGHSRWRAKGPAGTRVEWDAEIVQDLPNHRIAWRSRGDADVPNEGEVTFRPAPGARGTEIHVSLRYRPPAGALGAAIAKLFGEEPAQQIHGDLRRFKQVMETGEVVHSDASIHRGMHPARPSTTAHGEGEPS